MAEYLTNTTDLTKVASAIREKGGTSDKLVYPDGFVTAIGNIQTGGGGVDMRLNTITPDRYQSISNYECVLDLSGLITGKYFICELFFSGERMDGEGLANYGITISCVNSNPGNEDNMVVYAGPAKSGYQLTTLKSGSDHTYDLSTCIEDMKLDPENSSLSSAANSIDAIYTSYVVSWN